MIGTRLAAVSSESAYRVPWLFERGVEAGTSPNRFALRNLGKERLTGVTVNLYGQGFMPASAPSTVDPGDSLEVVIFGHNLSRDTIAVIRWFRPNEDEYLWRVSF